MDNATLKVLGEIADEISIENDQLIADFKEISYPGLEGSCLGDGEVLGIFKAGALFMAAKQAQKIKARMKC